MSEPTREEMISEIKAHREKMRLRTGLPHLHSKFKWYKWARIFFDSTNKENFLCAANQISKSSTSIRKCIHWATAVEMWPHLWPQTPNLFWYFYPSADVATTEWKTKWQQFMPAGEFKNHPVYGWREVFDKKHIKEVIFNSGVTIQFKTYEQSLANLQAATVFAIFADEEMPIDFLGELQFRLSAADGYFHMVFTATLGQDHWRRTIEPQSDKEEMHIGALKMQVSLYDCMVYEDGTPSRWTEDVINRRKQRCATKAEELKRIYGRFVKSEGLKYETYDPAKNRSPNHALPKDWKIYSAVDIGSGGEEGHPGGIVFVAVDSKFQRGRVFRAWRGDGIQTTAGDIYLQYKKLRGQLEVVIQSYDFSSKEFEIITSRANDSFQRANKGRDEGDLILNTLFKHQMLSIQRDDPELDKLSVELSTLLKSTPKQIAKDDLVDPLRYTVMSIPWDFSILDENPLGPDNQPETPKPKTQAEVKEDRRKQELADRRAQFFGKPSEDHSVEDELDAWGELLND